MLASLELRRDSHEETTLRNGSSNVRAHKRSRFADGEAMSPGSLSQGQTSAPCHDLSGIRVEAEGLNRGSTELSPARKMNQIAVTAAPRPPDKERPEPEGAPSSNPHPFTAAAFEAATGSQTCSVPPGLSGVTKVVRFRISDFHGQEVQGNPSVAEQFRLLEGPQDLLRKVEAQARDRAIRSERGFFNDCYRLYGPRPLPDDFRLRVEQNHLVDGEIISKNHILYTSRNILVDVFPRLPGSREFESRSKVF